MSRLLLLCNAVLCSAKHSVTCAQTRNIFLSASSITQESSKLNKSKTRQQKTERAADTVTSYKKSKTEGKLAKTRERKTERRGTQSGREEREEGVLRNFVLK